MSRQMVVHVPQARAKSPCSAGPAGSPQPDSPATPPANTQRVFRRSLIKPAEATRNRECQTLMSETPPATRSSALAEPGDLTTTLGSSESTTSRGSSLQSCSALDAAKTPQHAPSKFGQWIKGDKNAINNSILRLKRFAFDSQSPHTKELDGQETVPRTMQEFIRINQVKRDRLKRKADGIKQLRSQSNLSGDASRALRVSQLAANRGCKDFLEAMNYLTTKEEKDKTSQSYHMTRLSTGRSPCAQKPGAQNMDLQVILKVSQQKPQAKTPTRPVVPKRVATSRKPQPAQGKLGAVEEVMELVRDEPCHAEADLSPRRACRPVRQLAFCPDMGSSPNHKLSYEPIFYGGAQDDDDDEYGAEDDPLSGAATPSDLSQAPLHPRLSLRDLSPLTLRHPLGSDRR